MIWTVISKICYSKESELFTRMLQFFFKKLDIMEICKSTNFDSNERIFTTFGDLWVVDFVFSWITNFIFYRSNLKRCVYFVIEKGFSNSVKIIILNNSIMRNKMSTEIFGSVCT